MNDHGPKFDLMMTVTWGDRPDTLGIRERLKEDGDYRWMWCHCGTGERYFGEGVAAINRHARWHLDWDCGASIPNAVFWFDSLAVVNGESTLPERKVAYQLGRLFQREKGYDFPMAPDPKSWRGNLSEVLVAVHNGRAIGGLFTYPTTRYGVWDDGADRIPIDIELMEPQPQISGIWVCRGRRRQGVGSALVRALSVRADIPVGELIWGMPFSRDGELLARSLAPSGMRVS